MALKTPILTLLPSSPNHKFCTTKISDSLSLYVSISRVFVNRLNHNNNVTVARSVGTPTTIVNNNNDSVSSRNRTPNATSTVEIPVTCYQIIRVGNEAEKDEIVKSVMQLKSCEVDEGYTMDAVVSRQNLLMDVRDKLLFEPEYAGNVRDKIPPKSSLRIPWPWLPAALCLLQEAGEDKLVLNIGTEALHHPDSKPFAHDILLSMALAECAIAKIGFEKNKVSHGFEALARAQYLLRSKNSLGKMALLSQIEESLEELAPACTLELLGMPHSPENAERRRGSFAALRELLRQGLDVESSCRVQDWPCFLIQALNRLMASEIVDLIPWDDLALMRKNKKSLESQNQRIVIDFNCFYVALIAHIAVGFSSRQKELINKAKVICECLMTSEGMDLKFEEAFCMFLLGEGNEAQAVEKLYQLQLNGNHASRSLLSRKEINDDSHVRPSLETWLKDAVLAVFSDTRDCSPAMVKFFSDEKRVLGSKKNKTSSPTIPGLDKRPVSDISLKQMDCEESLPIMNSTQHFRSAVKQLSPTDLRSSLILGMNNMGGHVSEPSVQLQRNLGEHNRRNWESWLAGTDVVGKIASVALLGCILFFTLKLSGMNLRRIRTTSEWASSRTKTNNSSLFCTTDPSFNSNVGSAYIMENSIPGRIKKLLEIVKKQFQKQSDLGKLKTAGLAANLSSCMATVSRKQMPAEEAETLIKQWQAIKALALGPSHNIDSLSDVLDESMLAQWQALANAAKAKPCYWRFVLLQLSVLQAYISSDGYGAEMAEMEVILEEAAELVDESENKNPNYYSIYRIHYLLRRQDDGSWKFCESDIQKQL
ncbi:plastid division protein CDP1, chloroplastic [Mercurialis annua]|uniref:plastid division protein CDP1, chloroplastic n=1 Tax=Mercurialis annua TaxID=3986 RepID=UPI00215EA049|nr:plastid division protein CDP1, chloroplastic [Mercurialis annua]